MRQEGRDKGEGGRKGKGKTGGWEGMGYRILLLAWNRSECDSHRHKAESLAGLAVVAACRMRAGLGGFQFGLYNKCLQ